MADQDKKEKSIVLLNRGLRTYKTSVGDIPRGESLAVPEAEAKKLMAYRDLQDASKAMPQQAAKHAALEAENEDLRKQLSAASSTDVTALNARIAELEASLEAGEKENEKLKDALEKAQAKIEKLKDK